MKKCPSYSLVEIEWVDSCHTNGWTETSSVDWHDREVALCHRSAGYVAKETPRSISIVQSYQRKKDGKHPAYIDAIMTIPKVAIQKITILKHPEDDPVSK